MCASKAEGSCAAVRAVGESSIAGWTGASSQQEREIQGKRARPDHPLGPDLVVGCVKAAVVVGPEKFYPRKGHGRRSGRRRLQCIFVGVTSDLLKLY